MKIEKYKNCGYCSNGQRDGKVCGFCDGKSVKSDGYLELDNEKVIELFVKALEKFYE